MINLKLNKFSNNRENAKLRFRCIDEEQEASISCTYTTLGNNPDFQCLKFFRKQFKLKNKCLLLCLDLCVTSCIALVEKTFLFCAEKQICERLIFLTVSTATLGLYPISPSCSHLFSNSWSSTISVKLKGKRTSAQILPTFLPTMCLHFRIT